MTRPFVERPAEPTCWFFCCDCQETYDGRDGHECRSWRRIERFWSFERMLAVAFTACLVAWACVIAGLARWRSW